MTDRPLAVVDVPCPHDGEHPNGHVIAMKPKIGLEGAIYARERVVDVASNWGRVKAALSEAYVRYGPSEIDGKPITQTDIDALLADEAAGEPVAERGDELYSASVLAPFVKRMRELSQASQTEPSTSPPTDGSPKRPKRSKPSSISTTPTDSTETTSTEPE
jgi:hypothetical protein